MQQVGQVGPGIIILRSIEGTRCSLGSIQGIFTAHRVAGCSTLGRPARDHEEVRRQAPRAVGLEHFVLQYEVLGVGPVVRDFTRIVPAHYIRGLSGGTTGRIRTLAGFLSPAEGLNKAVHFSAGDVGSSRSGGMRAAGIHVSGVVVRLHTGIGLWVVDAHRRNPVLHRDTIHPRISTKVRIKRAVLLHNNDDVLDFVTHQPRLLARRGRGGRGRLAGLARLRRLGCFGGCPLFRRQRPTGFFDRCGGRRRGGCGRLCSHRNRHASRGWDYRRGGG